MTTIREQREARLREMYREAQNPDRTPWAERKVLCRDGEWRTNAEIAADIAAADYDPRDDEQALWESENPSWA